MVEAPAHDADRAFHILTLGCSKNRVDSDGMDHLLRSRGMTATERAEDARVVIVNTCGFLGAARDESVAASASCSIAAETIRWSSPPAACLPSATTAMTSPAASITC